MVRVPWLALVVYVFRSGSLQAQAPSNDTLRWIAHRSLTVTDFKEDPQTYTGLDGEALCLLLVDFKKPNALAATQYHAMAVFDRTASWLNPEVSAEENLRFFQTMFDLYELHARQIKKSLMDHSPKGDPTAFVKEQYDIGMNALMDEFNLFRKETRMGRDLEAVMRWRTRVRQDIAALSAYAER